MLLSMWMLIVYLDGCKTTPILLTNCIALMSAIQLDLLTIRAGSAAPPEDQRPVLMYPLITLLFASSVMVLVKFILESVSFS